MHISFFATFNSLQIIRLTFLIFYEVIEVVNKEFK